MALTPTISGTQARAIVTVGGPSGEVDVTQVRMLAVYNFPTEAVQVTQARTLAVVKDTGALIEVSEARALAVVRGRVDNPRLRAWTFTLDGHDFYVLRLGDDETLVYDTSSGQWSTWDSTTLGFWRSNVGMNWVGNGALPDTYGSNVVVGDDTFGLLWFLNPDQGFDDHPYFAEEDPQAFTRVVTGQLVQRRREATPCNEVYLTADLGDPMITGAAVTLSSSDDAGHTYTDHGTITAVPADYTQEFAWRSLGQIVAPGRLFRITDNGAFARIDGLDMDGE